MPISQDEIENKDVNISEHKEAASFLRERFLYLIASLPAKPCKIGMYNKTEVSAQIRTFDLSFENVLVKNLKPANSQALIPKGHKLLQETSRWVAPITDSPKPPPSRITLTFPVINNARVCAFAISGKEKAEMIKRVHVDKEDLPAARVKPISGQIHWIVDKDAGVFLNKL